MYKKELFGLNKDGSYKTWSIEVREYICPVEDKNTVSISIRHGKEGGKQTLKQEFIYEGK